VDAVTLDELIERLCELREQLSGHTRVLFVCDECGHRELGDIGVGDGGDQAEVWIEEA